MSSLSLCMARCCHFFIAGPGRGGAAHGQAQGGGAGGGREWRCGHTRTAGEQARAERQRRGAWSMSPSEPARTTGTLPGMPCTQGVPWHNMLSLIVSGDTQLESSRQAGKQPCGNGPHDSTRTPGRLPCLTRWHLLQLVAEPDHGNGRNGLLKGDAHPAFSSHNASKPGMSHHA